MLYPPPIQCPKLETGQPKNKQKNGPLENIFLCLYTGFGVKIQNTNGQKSSLNFFDIWEIGTYQPSKQPSGDILKNPK